MSASYFRYLRALTAVAAGSACMANKDQAQLIVGNRRDFELEVALTLRTLGGLSIAEIARAFLVTEAMIAQRVARAKQKIVRARIPYEIPDRATLAPRLNAVLSVLYLMFNEGTWRLPMDTSSAVTSLPMRFASRAVCLRSFRTSRSRSACWLLCCSTTHGARRVSAMLAILCCSRIRIGPKWKHPQIGRVFGSSSRRCACGPVPFKFKVRLLRSMPKHRRRRTQIGVGLQSCMNNFCTMNERPLSN